MTYIDQEPWPEPPLAADEATAIVAALERQRATLAWKTGGLDAEGLRTTAAASAITLGSLLKHMAVLEDDTFTRRIAGRAMVPPWTEVDWDAHPNWDWDSAADDAPEELYALYRDAVTRSRAALADVLAEGGLDQPVTSMTDETGSFAQPAAGAARPARGVRATLGATPTSSGNRSTGWSAKIDPTDGRWTVVGREP